MKKIKLEVMVLWVCTLITLCGSGYFGAQAFMEDRAEIQENVASIAESGAYKMEIWVPNEEQVHYFSSSEQLYEFQRSIGEDKKMRTILSSAGLKALAKKEGVDNIHTILKHDKVSYIYVDRLFNAHTVTKPEGLTRHGLVTTSFVYEGDGIVSVYAKQNKIEGSWVTSLLRGFWTSMIAAFFIGSGACILVLLLCVLAIAFCLFGHLTDYVRKKRLASTSPSTQG